MRGMVWIAAILNLAYWVLYFQGKLGRFEVDVLFMLTLVLGTIAEGWHRLLKSR